ncbi:26S proteasome regulatory subunit N11 [Pancytospora epiphaga]|nr:26S proteasome regulatory subunit N11 [Pancytospora epiphaga]
MDNSFYGYEVPSGASPDTSETIQISSLALLKMMKHGRAGIPLEVMGLMLGEFIDEYNIKVVDVFAMPQSGTGVTVEAVDPVFQTTMMETLKQTGRHETVVGWYHSHPGFGCWLSSTDVSTQSSFEQLCKRTVAVVIDPIQSVKGKVVIDAFRNINPTALGGDPRITTSNIGFLKQPTFISLVHGLNKSYYSFNIVFRKNDLEKKMLLNMNRKSWADNLKPVKNQTPRITEIIEKYCDTEKEEAKQTKEELELKKVGKVDYRKHLKEKCNEIIETEAINNLLHSIHRFIFQ